VPGNNARTLSCRRDQLITRMVQQRALISVVDDDESIREALPELLRVLGFETQAFDSATAFLQSPLLEQTRCLILDVLMPGMSGPQLFRELRLRDLRIPVIFMTAYCDQMLRAQLLATGAVGCLCKPFGPEELCSALDTALALPSAVPEISKNRPWPGY
jgi:FixJ family two-component response regulator